MICYRYLHRSIVDGKLGHTFKGGIISLLGARFVDRNDDFEALAREIPGLYIGASAIPFTIDNGLMADDNIHYTQAGDNIIGEELGKKAAELMNRERQTDTGMASLIGTIPIIILAGLLMALAVGIVRRRDI